MMMCSRSAPCQRARCPVAEKPVRAEIEWPHRRPQKGVAREKRERESESGTERHERKCSFLEVILLGLVILWSLKLI